MRKYSIPLTLLLFSCLSANEPTETPYHKENTPTDCGDGARPIRLAVRHIEAGGIGYDEGYTTIEGFVTPIYPNKWLPFKDEWLPFADLRLHIFNDGRPALNAGIGIRYLTSHMIWGANFYYDYRNTSRQHYNQVAIGFEGLGRIWDFRINGYLPVGDTDWKSQAKFAGFQGNYMMLSQKRQFALKGFNAEAGVHISEFKNERISKMFSKTPFYVAAGPYYLEGHGQNSWGAQARFTLDFFEYLRIEGNTSYDKIFHGVGQGQLTVMIPLGRRKKVYARKGQSCGRALAMNERALQRVDRNEIIPVDKKHTKSPAIDPATGQPITFWYVNNLSHSSGTIESPFPTLFMAQVASSPNDVIYIFPGDGTDSGMNTGIFLQDNQRLLSTSMTYSFNTTQGTITIPAMTAGMPTISNAIAANPVVILADNNQVSGLVIEDFQSDSAGITGSTATMTTLIDSCTIESDDGTGINFDSIPNLGNVTISNCSISAGGTSTGAIYYTNLAALGTTTISGCAIAAPNSKGIYFFNNEINITNISNCNVEALSFGIAFIDNLINEVTISDSNTSTTDPFSFGILIGPSIVETGIVIDSCNMTSAGESGFATYDTPAETPPPFVLSLLNTTATGTVSGYSIDNPATQSDYILYLKNVDVGLIDFQDNPVTIIME